MKTVEEIKYEINDFELAKFTAEALGHKTIVKILEEKIKALKWVLEDSEDENSWRNKGKVL